MGDDRQSTSAAGGARGYKRSWKNLLINKRYQLRFTLFMVAVSAALMAGLGWWVMKVADEATRVQQNNVMSNGCKPAVLGIPAVAKEEPADDTDEPTPVVKEEDDIVPGPAPEPAPEEPTHHRNIDVVEEPLTLVARVPVDDLVSAEGYRMRVQVRVDYTAPETSDIPDPKEITNQLEPVIDEAAREQVAATRIHDLFSSDLDILAAAQTAKENRLKELAKAVSEAKAPPEKAEAQKALDEAKAAFTAPIVGVHVEQPVLNPMFMTEVAGFYECNYAQIGRLHRLDDGRARILYVLFGSCALLTIGLAVYGIKMTHKVAGPLYKISLYMGKMRDGRLDKVYNLRKGDQLVDFYEHFKTAHAGVVDLEKADIAQLQALIAAADKAEIAGKSPEVDAALAEMRALLARKEKALE